MSAVAPTPDDRRTAAVPGKQRKIPDAFRLLQTLRERCGVDRGGRERSGLLRTLAALTVRLHARHADPAQRDLLIDALSLLLHEPRARSRMILRANQAHLLLLEERRERRCRPAASRQLRDQVRWPGREHWVRAIRHDVRSRIMVTYHYGDYLHGLSLLSTTEPPDRARILLRNRETSPGATANLQELYRHSGLSLPRIVVARDADVLALRHRLRGGDCTLTTFCDLPPGHGATQSVPFLGHMAHMCSGPAQLAVSAGVPVVPVILAGEGGQQELRVGPALDPGSWRGLGYAGAVERVMRFLLRPLEEQLGDQPHLWRYLSILPAYFQRCP